jgi:hypothetical protein
MPKSRRRKRHVANPQEMSPRLQESLNRQREAFIAKFGREPGPDDPVFFDPNEDKPTLRSPVEMKAKLLEIMRKAGTPPQLVYAYEKTGFILSECNWDQHPPDRRKEWEDAIDEYFAIENASRDKPHPKDWSTQIPELLASPFGQEDLDQVMKVLAAITPIEAQGMKLVTRMEIAAALLARAADHGYLAAEDVIAEGEGPNFFDLAESIVVRRAREIYARGGSLGD